VPAIQKPGIKCGYSTGSTVTCKVTSGSYYTNDKFTWSFDGEGSRSGKSVSFTFVSPVCHGIQLTVSRTGAKSVTVGTSVGAC